MVEWSDSITLGALPHARSHSVPVACFASNLAKGHNIMSLPVTASAAREVDVVGVFRYRDAYPTAIHLVGSG